VIGLRNQTSIVARYCLVSLFAVLRFVRNVVQTNICALPAEEVPFLAEQLKLIVLLPSRPKGRILKSTSQFFRLHYAPLNGVEIRIRVHPRARGCFVVLINFISEPLASSHHIMKLLRPVRPEI